MGAAAIITLDEYDRLIACGAFAGRHAQPIELIQGELRMMSPQGAEHAELVAQLNDWSHDVADRRQVKIRIQSSVELRQLDSQPEPDVVWAKAKSYAHQRPQPPEILLVIEVADNSLAYDLNEKCLLYGAAGIRDYWVVDVPNRVVHVFRDPQSDGYRSREEYSMGHQVTPLLFPHASLSVIDLFRCLEA